MPENGVDYEKIGSEIGKCVTSKLKQFDNNELNGEHIRTAMVHAIYDALSQTERGKKMKEKGERFE